VHEVVDKFILTKTPLKNNYFFFKMCLICDNVTLLIIWVKDKYRRKNLLSYGICFCTYSDSMGTVIF